jgi:hypothetical protein
VRRARSRLGECHYDLLHNNCEHFCSWCELAEPRSPQVEALSAPLRLLLQAAVSIGPRWKRFLWRVALLKSEGHLSASRELHAAKWASGHVNRWSACDFVRPPPALEGAKRSLTSRSLVG